ncbi:hypothetical protein AX14_011794, partial [Amanita brunnescens Koide BX004]
FLPVAANAVPTMSAYARLLPPPVLMPPPHAQPLSPLPAMPPAQQPPLPMPASASPVASVAPVP